LFIVDGSDPGIRLFDSAGRLIRSTGRLGIGPGELAEIWRVFRLAGDTIAVATEGQQILLFTGAGDFVRAFAPRDVHSYAYAMFADGGIVAVPRVPSTADISPASPSRGAGPRTTIRPAYQPFRIADREGRSLLDLGRMESSIRGQGWQALYGPRRYHAARERYYTAFGAEYSIGVRSTKGALIQIVRRDVQPDPVTTAQSEQAKNAILEKTRGTDLEEHFSSLVPQMESVPYHPLISEILVDASEHLWVREYRIQQDGIDRSEPQSASAGEPQRYNIVSTDGQWRGSVDGPAQLQLTDLGEDYIAGMRRDEDLVESGRVYGLARGAR
jgi:hypothetical protein